MDIVLMDTGKLSIQHDRNAGAIRPPKLSIPTRERSLRWISESGHFDVFFSYAGMAGALWSETVRTPSQLQSMIYPRLLALAERAWHKACFENEVDKVKRDRIKDMEWEAFANTLGHKELARLDKMNIDYHIPVPGARYILISFI